MCVFVYCIRLQQTFVSNIYIYCDPQERVSVFHGKIPFSSFIIML